MKDKDKVEMLLLLIQNVDVFAWNPYEVPKVDPKFIVHKLNVDPLFPPKKQKPRRLAKEHVEAIKQEVRRLKEVGGFLPKMAGKYYGYEEEELEMEGLRRLF